MMAHDMLLAGTHDVMVAGGMESMTNAPYLLQKGRGGYRLGHDRIFDHMMLDGLEDAYEPGRSMGTFGEDCAAKYQFTREQQDAFAMASVQRAQDAIKNGGFGVIVSGRSKGCGSSRETAPYSEREAGIQIVVAKSIEKIYGQNCQNIGLLTTTDFGVLDRVARGEEIPISEFTKGLDRISANVYSQRSRTDQGTLQTRSATAASSTPATLRDRTFLFKSYALGLDLQAEGRFDALGARHRTRVHGDEGAARQRRAGAADAPAVRRRKHHRPRLLRDGVRAGPRAVGPVAARPGARALRVTRGALSWAPSATRRAVTR